MKDNNTRKTRRTFIKQTAGGICLGAVSGCLGVFGDTEAETSTPVERESEETGTDPVSPTLSPTPTPTSSPAPTESPDRDVDLPGYTDWVFNIGVVFDHLPFVIKYYDYPHIQKYASHLSLRVDQQLAYANQHLANLNLIWEEIDHAIAFRLGRANVFVPRPERWNRRHVQDRLAQKGYRPAANYEGFRIMRIEEAKDVPAERAYGLSDRYVVVGTIGNKNDSKTAVETAKNIIDAKYGIAPRYAEESETIAKVAGAIGTPASMARVWRHEKQTYNDLRKRKIKGTIGRGWAWKLQGKTTKLKIVFGYEDETLARKKTLEKWITQDEIMYNAKSVTIETDGKIGVVTGVVETESLQRAP